MFLPREHMFLRLKHRISPNTKKEKYLFSKKKSINIFYHYQIFVTFASSNINYINYSLKTKTLMKQILRYSMMMALMLVCAMGNAKTIRVYKKATTVESGKAYLIAANVGDNKLKVATLMTNNYGYLSVVDATDVSGEVEMEDATSDYTITATDGGYTLQMSDGRYLYQQGTYNSFNFNAAPTEGQVWTIEAQTDGTFKITNVSKSKYVQYSTGYKSYGSYASAQDGGVLPNLYVFDKTKEVPDDPNAKGSEANPYTVADVQALTGDFPSAKVWVKGYIAGCVNTSKGSELSTADPVATNIGLSATAQVESVIPVQLSAGEVRTALNLADNAGNLGKEVLVYGNIATYCGATGVKTVTAYKLTGNSVSIVTNINIAKADTTADAPVYNLKGQKVEAGYKGLVIKNGKKVMQK